MSALQIKWAITRLRRLFALWDWKLDRIDKEYCLRRIRDKEPELFYGIARER
jgi:hypothetical protein